MAFVKVHSFELMDDTHPALTITEHYTMMKAAIQRLPRPRLTQSFMTQGSNEHIVEPSIICKTLGHFHLDTFCS